MPVLRKSIGHTIPPAVLSHAPSPNPRSGPKPIVLPSGILLPFGTIYVADRLSAHRAQRPLQILDIPKAPPRNCATLRRSPPPFEYVSLAQLELKPKPDCAVQPPFRLYPDFSSPNEASVHSPPASSSSVSSLSDSPPLFGSSCQSPTSVATSEHLSLTQSLSQSPALPYAWDKSQNQDQHLPAADFDSKPAQSSEPSSPDNVSPQSLNLHGTPNHLCSTCRKSFTQAHVLK